MAYEITRGPQYKAQKVLIYGVEGIGKTTFAAQFPRPLFIDTEGGSNTYDVARLPKPTSWTMFMDEIREAAGKKLCKTLVIDTIDWAERMCTAQICAAYNVKGVEDFSYGKGYIYVYEEFGRFLNLLSDVVDYGINVVLVAHAQIYKFEQPDEAGAYDRYTLKLTNKTGAKISSMVKEWADMVLFANYKTLVIIDSKTNKAHAQGRERVMYTTHHAAWDAKNRHDLPEELPFKFASIAACIPSDEAPEPVHKEQPAPVEVPKETSKPTPVATSAPEKVKPAPKKEEPVNDQVKMQRAVVDLMTKDHIKAKDIQKVVAQKGYFPENMPISEYPADFITGWVIQFWPQIVAMVNQNKIECPFEDKK